MYNDNSIYCDCVSVRNCFHSAPFKFRVKVFARPAHLHRTLHNALAPIVCRYFTHYKLTVYNIGVQYINLFGPIFRKVFKTYRCNTLREMC